MICLIALPIFAVMALFSATHRRLFLEALDCVFRKATLRKCQSSLDERLKAKISGTLINKNPKIGNFVFRRFEILSSIFLVLMILSLIFSVQGIYSYIKYGNCNGQDSKDFCILNFGSNETSVNQKATQKDTFAGVEANCTEENNVQV
ncbi:hypothetical protein J4443_03095 [Candidatus Woesearchaeota archaeon]|nr:hypothetical protein [Candidatus Woesearchaeota archaeon]